MSAADTISYSLQKQRDVSMNATWMYVYTASLYLSCLSTMFATYHMRKLGGDILRSTVRFVITCFLMCSTLHALAGGLFYSFLIAETQQVVEHEDAEAAANATTSAVASRLLMVMLSSGASSSNSDDDNAIDSLVIPDNKDDGGEAAFITKLTHDARPLSHVLTTFLMLENMFFLFSAYWIFLVTTELFKLAMATLDRGMQNERATIRKYMMGAAVILLTFTSVGLPIVITHKGYNKAYRLMSIAELLAIIVSVLYATGSLVVLRCSGRKHEHIHGMLMASPLYRRLKLMMIVCIVFTLPYCFLQIGLLGMKSSQVDNVPDYLVGLATMLYYLFGAAQALVMGGSQQCCIRLLSPIIPTHIRNSPEWANLRASRRHDSYLGYEEATPPEKPVFVISDIESSSALWSIAPPHVIDAAQQIHDDLMRSCLPKYNGYEITTVGDSFQLAFHNVQDAVGYALEVQLQLLQAKWPSELDGIVASTKTEWAIGLKPQAIFRGIRVRMGIHDTSVEEEGKLVSQIHLVTGKTLYIGASEFIAREVGEVGFGGQIIISKRIAAWLRTGSNEKKVATPFSVDYYGTHEVNQLEIDVELYELTPKVVDARRKAFRKRRGLEESRVAEETARENSDSAVTMELPLDTESTTDEASGDYKSQRTPTAAIRAGLSRVMWRKG
ncbi:Adenylate cyclase [Globisporangium polare]